VIIYYGILGFAVCVIYSNVTANVYLHYMYIAFSTTFVVLIDFRKLEHVY